MAEIDFSQFTVLLVEDNDFVRFMVKKHLSGFGFRRVVEASDGQEGIQLFNQTEPDIVVCDISMQPMDGFEFLKHIRNLNTPLRKVPFIFLTSRAESSAVVKARALEIDAYLIKPVMPQNLKNKITQILTKRMSA